MNFKRVSLLFVVVVAAIATGCRPESFDVIPIPELKTPKEPAPLELSMWQLNLDVGETAIVKITGGNGEYSIVPNTETYTRYARDPFERLDDGVFTISEKYVKTSLEGDRIRFERIALFEDEQCHGSYTVSDTSGQTFTLVILNPKNAISSSL